MTPFIFGTGETRPCKTRGKCTGGVCIGVSRIHNYGGGRGGISRSRRLVKDTKEKSRIALGTGARVDDYNMEKDVNCTGT